MFKNRSNKRVTFKNRLTAMNNDSIVAWFFKLPPFDRFSLEGSCFDYTVQHTETHMELGWSNVNFAQDRYYYHRFKRWIELKRKLGRFKTLINIYSRIKILVFRFLAPKFLCWTYLSHLDPPGQRCFRKREVFESITIPSLRKDELGSLGGRWPPFSCTFSDKLRYLTCR